MKTETKTNLPLLIKKAQISGNERYDHEEKIASFTGERVPPCRFSNHPERLDALKACGFDSESDMEETVDAAITYATAYRNAYETRWLKNHF